MKKDKPVVSEVEPAEWEKALQFEVMENYLFDAEGLYDDEDGTKRAKMREHWGKLVAFISSLLQAEREKARKEGYEVAQKILNQAHKEARLSKINEIKER